MRNIFLLLVFALSFSLKAQLRDVDLSAINWSPCSESDQLLCFYKTSINTDVYSYRYTHAEEDDYQDMDGNKVIYRNCGIDLPSNEEGGVISFTLTNDHKEPHAKNYKIAEVSKSGKEKEAWFSHDIYWGYDVRIDHIDGSCSWHSHIYSNSTFVNRKGTRTAEYSTFEPSWTNCDKDVHSIDVSIVFNGDKHKASIDGKVYNNVKRISRINLRIGPAARLHVSDFTMKIGQLASPEWNNQTIRANIDANNDGLCGLYLVDEITLGVVKVDNDKYQILYVDGMDENDLEEPGELFATGEMTAVPGIVAFRTAQKNRVFYMAVDGMTMRWAKKPGGCFANDAEVYLKMYPSSNSVTLGSNSSSNASSSSNQNSSGNTNKSLQIVGSGTGFLIDKRGYLATNHHVIDGAGAIGVCLRIDGEWQSFDGIVIKDDPTNDLAIIKIEDPDFKGFENLPYAFSFETEDIASEIFTLGYPQVQVMGTDVKYTTGVINARTGIQGDPTHYQISAHIDHGNSGGPLFNEKGYIIGITDSGLDKAKFGDVNYAIKSTYLKVLADALPKNLEFANDSSIAQKRRTEQIKTLSEYVALILIAK